MAPSSSDPAAGAFDLDSLYREHAASIYAWACLRLAGGLRQSVSPEDLAQEIWVRAARSAKARHANSGPARAWLFTIAKHVLYEVRRAAERQRSDGSGGSGGTTRLLTLDQVPADITSLTQRLARDETLRQFLSQAEALDEDDRLLLIHVGLEGMPQTEIAPRLGMSYEALAKRWQRLRDRLQKWPSAAQLLP